MSKLFRQKSSIVGLVTDLANINSSIATETSRASGIESGLRTDLTAETTRATGAELVLRTDLTAEVTRASGVESVLRTDLTAEAARAAGEESRIEAKFDASTAATDANVARIDGDELTEGSFRKAIKTAIDGLVNGADGAFDTLKEIEDYIKVSPDTDVLSAILNSVNAAKVELKGTVSTAMDTLGEIEAAVSAEIARASAIESGLRTDLTAETARATSEEARIEAKFDAGVADVSAALAQEVIDRNAAIASQSNKTKNASGTVADGKVSFDVAPVGGLDGVAFGTARIFGVDETNPKAFDEVEISLDSSDASGKTFIVASDVTGEYNGKTAVAFVSYNPAA